MRKEVVFAIFAGCTLGLIIAFGAWRANIALSTKGNSNNIDKPKATILPTGELRVVIAKPSEQEVLTSSPVVISGITTNKAQILVSGEDSDTFDVASSSGSFDTSIDLVGGINQIKVFAFNDSNQITNANLLLVYSSSFSKQISTTANSASGSADSILNKVNEKVKEAASLATSYIGTVTDISDSGIQIKTKKSEIQQISPNKDDITYIKTTNGITKEIKSTDLAIGDFIVAMGTKNGNSILHASRILVTDAVKDDAKTAIIGNISDTGRGQVTVGDLNIIPDDSITITTGDNVKTKVTRFSSLDTGWKIIAVGTKDSKGNLVARHVRVLDIPASTPTPKS